MSPVIFFEDGYFQEKCVSDKILWMKNYEGA